MQPHNPTKLAKWLDKLQRESWQLELLISGFAIFLMVGAIDWLKSCRLDLRLASQGMAQGSELIALTYAALSVMCFFILLNLILHVLLRGMWISTIGLRYVSGDIDLNSLRLAPKFDRLLHKKIGSFDQYILKLENICSVVFAFTFLIAFMILAFGLYFIFLISFIGFFVNGLLEGLPEETAKIIGISIIVTLFLAGLLYFIDFLTLGFLKRIKWLSHVYLPVYRFMSVITLSFLYRPIYYNLIDNKFGRRIGLLLVPYVLIIIFLMSERIQSHTWYPDITHERILLKDHYDDQRSEERLVWEGSLPSKFVNNGFLELFIAYTPRQDNKVLEEICPDFKPFHDVGISSDIRIGFTSTPEKERTDAPDTALVCLSQLYETYVDDSLFFENTFRFHRHSNKDEYGLISMLDVNHLKRGEHLVKVNRWHVGHPDNKDSLVMQPHFQIPFWVE